LSGPDGDTPVDRPAGPTGAPGSEGPDPTSTPPGGAIFSLERPAAGLYLVAWLLTGIGLGFVIVGVVSTSSAKALLVLLGAIMAATGLAAAAGYQVVARRASRSSEAYRGPSPVLAFVLSVALSATFAVALGMLGLLETTTGADFLLGLLVVAVAYAAVIELFVVRTGALSWNAMGWPTGMGRVGRFVGDAAFGLIVTVPVVVPVLVGAGLLAALLGVQPTARIPIVEGGLESLLVVLGAALVAPVGEELFFRGFALTAWRRDLGARSALIRSAIFFALVHVANVGGATFGDAAREALLQVAVILPLGFVLGWVYERHGIGASIAGHVGYNASLLVLAAAAGQLGGAPI
jgi:membrane protease YdiL (CAAX protease family)